MKILTFGFSPCASMKADGAAMHKLQDGNKDTTNRNERSWLVMFNTEEKWQQMKNSKHDIKTM